MSFGISGTQGKPAMVGADIVVAYWNESASSGVAVDYTVTHAAQCDGKLGVCPDTRLGGSNDVIISTFSHVIIL